MDDSRPLQSRLLHCADCAPREGLSRRGLLFGAVEQAGLQGARVVHGVSGTGVLTLGRRPTRCQPD